MLKAMSKFQGVLKMLPNKCIKHGGLPLRSAFRRTVRIVSKLSSKHLVSGKFALYVFRKFVGLGIDLG